MIKTLPLLIILVCISFSSHAQDKWQLVKDEDGIKVYTRRLDNEKFKEVKANFELKGSPDQLIAILQNVTHQKDWSFGTKRAYLISRKNRETITYYSEISLPWPLSNRDLVIQLSFKKDTINKILHIQAKSIAGILPDKPSLVRVPYSMATWIVNILPDKKLNVQYTLSTNPGGILPAWLVNYAASVGPYNSFNKLKDVMGKMNP
jgi:hypothetical protein